MAHQLRKYENRNGGFLPSFLNRYFNEDMINNFFEGNNMPATNVTENDKEFKIELYVPGFSKEDFNIELEDNMLRISATKENKNEEKDENEKVLLREFSSSSFSRSFTLPENINVEDIQASQKEGMLQITIPKMEKAPEDKVRKIDIM